MKQAIATGLAAIMLATAAQANECNWQEPSFWEQQNQAGRVAACIAAGAAIAARAKNGKLPADLAENNKAVRNDPVFWNLNEARFD
ncbi:MAG: hypothetical protein GDA53_08480 [Rhodobacteraceae bacterium]|nr:hypothetical protein [Paracoccaceae bacterium]